MQVVDNEQKAQAGVADDFELLLSGPPAASSSEQDLTRVVDMEKLAATRAVPSTLDLSVPAPGETPSRPEDAPLDSQEVLARVKEVVGSVLPSTSDSNAEGKTNDGKIKTEGFGSEDVFGNKEKPRTLSTEAAEAWTKVVDRLPDQVKQYVKAPEAQEGGISGTAASASSSRAGAGLEGDHNAQAVHRACEGKWVPTYMRQQLARGGHTQLPTGVNAHEYGADRPPPSVGSTFREMGEEVHENAQAVLAYVVAFISTIALQCQMCGQNVATTAHENIQEPGFCCGQAIQTNEFTGTDEDSIFNRLPDEASAGLGPVRSRVQRTMQGASLERVLDIAKTKLVTRSVPQVAVNTSQLPPLFQRLVKSRELQRQVVDRAGLVECVFATTEVNLEGMPPEAVQLLGVPGPQGGELSFREKWRVDWSEGKASVEFSNQHLEKCQVVVAIRLDIVDLQGAGGGSEADSRLYVKPRSHGAVMPLGLVERLTEMHHLHCESLRDAVLSLVQELEPFMIRPSPVPTPQAATGGDAASPPVMTLEKSNVNLQPIPEKRPCKAQDQSCLNDKLQVQPVGGHISLDKSLLLQVADGI
jgi:hypothetical protein